MSDGFTDVKRDTDIGNACNHILNVESEIKKFPTVAQATTLVTLYQELMEMPRGYFCAPDITLCESKIKKYQKYLKKGKKK